MPLTALPNIALNEMLRLMPPLGKTTLVQVSGTKHLVLGSSDATTIRDAILIGKIKEHTSGRDLSNANIWMDVSRPKVALIFGRRGSGKSYGLGVLIEGLNSQDGPIKVGNHTPPIIVFDPLNQFWTLTEEPDPSDPEEARQLKLIEEWGLSPAPLSNVRIFIPRGTRKRHPNSEEFSIDVGAMDASDWCGFFKVDKYTDPTGQLLSSAYRKVVEDGYRTVTSVEVSANRDYTIRDLVSCITHDIDITDPQTGFSIQTRRAVLSRLGELLDTPIFSGEGVNVRSIFVPGQVCVFMLREVDESTRSVVVSQIVKKIMRARGTRWEAEEVAKKLMARSKKLQASNPKESSKFAEQASKLNEQANKEGVEPGWIVIDEAHTLCPDKEYSAAKDILIEYVKQGRAMGLSLAAATQQPSALSTKLISQRDLILVHHLGIKGDVDAALGQMNPSFPDAIIDGRNEITTNVPYLLLNSLKRGEAIASTDELSRNFIVTVRPRVSSHGGKEPVFV